MRGKCRRANIKVCTTWHTHTDTREHTYSRLLDLICPLRLLPFCPFEIPRYPIGDAVKVNFPLRWRFFKHKDHTRNFLYFTQNCFICAEPRSSCEGCSRRRVNDVFIKCSDVSLYIGKTEDSTRAQKLYFAKI